MPPSDRTPRTDIELPDFGLVVLVGAHGTGKSTLAAVAFPAEAIVSRSAFRRDETFLAEVVRRLDDRRLVVADDVHAVRGERVRLVRAAAARHATSVALVLDARNVDFASRVPEGRRRDAVPHQVERIRGTVGGFANEGFASVHVLDARLSPEEHLFSFVPTIVDRRSERGPFDVVGDLHGCFEELVDLLTELGYEIHPYDRDATDPIRISHPDGRRLCLTGDLVDRGPHNVECLRLAMGLVEHGTGFVVPGNHDAKMMRALAGAPVGVGPNLRRTLDQLEGVPGDFARRVETFVGRLPHHLWLDGGDLVLSHAGTPADMIGRDSKAVRQFCLYGIPDKERAGARIDWARDYAGAATVVHGHVVVPEPRVLNGVVDVDTGCAFGGALSAFRWPEREFVSVPAREVYAGHGPDLPTP